MTDETQLERWRASIRWNTERYLRCFGRIAEAGGWAPHWNMAAFLHSTGWFWYRRMYVILNKTDRKLDLFLEHRFAPGWKLVDTPPPAEKTENFYRFRIEVPPKATTKFVVNEKGEESEALTVHNANREQLRLWVESRYIDGKTSEALEECMQLFEKAAALARRVQEREKEIGEIFQNQERLRKNLQALGGSQDEKSLRERTVADLSKDEARIVECRVESKTMREEKDRFEGELRARLGRLKFETVLG